jgi:hypothetical protein
VNRIEADDHTGDEVDAISDQSRMTLRRHVAEMLDQAIRHPEQPTLPPELLLERRLAALRSEGGPAQDGGT